MHRESEERLFTRLDERFNSKFSQQKQDIEKLYQEKDIERELKRKG